MAELKLPVAEEFHSLLVKVTRQPFEEWFKLDLPGGHTEELDPEETREFFRVRGADMDMVEKALDHCWNLYHVNIEIMKPKSVVLTDPRTEPNI